MIPTFAASVFRGIPSSPGTIGGTVNVYLNTVLVQSASDNMIAIRYTHRIVDVIRAFGFDELTGLLIEINEDETITVVGDPPTITDVLDADGFASLLIDENETITVIGDPPTITDTPVVTTTP